MNMSKNLVAMACLGLLITAGCAVEGESPTLNECPTGNCGTPWGKSQTKCGGDDTCLQKEAEAQCKERRNETQTGSQRGFVKNAIRWSCADVKFVDTNGRDDRGQEYCEYYAAVQLPPEDKPRGRNGVKLPPVVTPGRFLTNGVDKIPIDLSEHQVETLSETPNAVVGQCIFTSWHQDIKKNYPNCSSGQPGAGCANLAILKPETAQDWGARMANFASSLPFTPLFFKMKVGFNSNNAAVDLVDQCLTNPNAALAGERADHFERACMHMFKVFTTHWRKSDPSVCAGAMRLAECGCGLDVTKADGKPGQDGVVDIKLGQKDGTPSNYEQIARALVPNTRRGFLLGGWDENNQTKFQSDKCRFVTEAFNNDGQITEDSRTLVACDITANDVVDNAQDVKEFCRKTYAKDIVVYVPVPTEAVVCTPPGEGHGTVAECGTHPWVLGQENGRNGRNGGSP